MFLRVHHRILADKLKPLPAWETRVMKLQPRARSVSRRSAFTLLEVLVVVAIILVLASVATVAVLQIQKENKGDAAKINAMNLEKALKTYMLKNDGNPPGSIQDI